MIRNSREEGGAELQSRRVSSAQLPHRIQELQEHRRALRGSRGRRPGTRPLRGRRRPCARAEAELMAKGEPLFADERRESFHGARVRIEAKLRKRRELCGAVPAVGAVHERRPASPETASEAGSARQDGHQQSGPRCSHDGVPSGAPLGRLPGDRQLRKVARARQGGWRTLWASSSRSSGGGGGGARRVGFRLGLRLHRGHEAPIVS
mmetsp:Transcript_11081/g.42783  ORF Transcript_11081/g.42783 Transcript_11081/m.42783 type:complete len:207 (-) Transcript_11081:333-953(-)